MAAAAVIAARSRSMNETPTSQERPRTTSSLKEVGDHFDDIFVRADVLVGRLKLEKDVIYMMLKLPMFIVSFSCFIVALAEFAPAESVHAVHRHLKHHFSLDKQSLGGIKDIDTIYNYMEKFEHKNAELQATSAKYWCEHRYTDQYWDEKLAVPVTTCNSPRQYALSLTSDQSSLWSVAATNSQPGSRRGQQQRHLAGVPACDDYDEDLQKKTGDVNTTCANASVDSHHKVCEEDLGILLCPKTCGFCSPFTYEHKQDFIKPQVTMLPISVFQTRFSVSDCHGFAHRYELQKPNALLTLLPALDGERKGRVLTCVDRKKHAETQYSHEVPCPPTAPLSQCPDGKLRYSHKRTYHGTTVYPKMLIEPHRDVEAMKSIQWLDLQTETTVLSTLVYTEDIEIFTLLEVKFQVDEAGNIDSMYTMISYRDLIGQARVTFVACLSICMVVSFIQLAFMAYRFFTRGAECSWGYLCYECFARIVMLVYPAILLITWSFQVPMAKEYDLLLHTFLDIEGMSESHVDGAMDSYFGVLSHVYAETSWMKQHRIVGYLVVYTQFLQFIFYMNAHPKMASLTATLMESMSNLLHFLVLFVLIFAMLAFMAHWMLGEHIKEFGTYGTALFSQMQMFYGAFIKAEDTDELQGVLWVMYWVYAWTFMLVIWLLLLNFLLAIIVDAFVEVKEKFKDMAFIANFATDMVTVCHTRIIALRYGWPPRGNLIESFEEVIKHASDKPQRKVAFKGRAGATSMFKKPTKSMPTVPDKCECEEETAKPPTCRPAEMMKMFHEFRTREDVTRFLHHYDKICPDIIELRPEAKNSSEVDASAQLPDVPCDPQFGDSWDGGSEAVTSDEEVIPV